MYLKLSGRKELMANININNRVIHRFIREISDYEIGGELYSQVIPLDTQAYAIYPVENGNRFFYVIGDGEHTYTELRDGKGNHEVYREYPVLTKENLSIMVDGVEQEIEDRKAADLILKELIEKEIAAREAGDKVLQEQIDDNEESMSVLQSHLAKEINDRKADTSSLRDELSEEKTIRGNADKDLSARLEEEIIDRTQFDELLDEVIGEEIVNRESAIKQVYEDLKTKLDKVNTSSVVYGTDKDGNQTTYNLNELGSDDTVLDVKIGDKSVVADRVATLGTMAGESAKDYYTIQEVDKKVSDIEDLMYQKPIVEITGGGKFENGSSISIELNWTVNKDIITQSLTPAIGTIDKTLRSYTIENVTSSEQFIITVDDGVNSASAYTNVEFLDKIYWGSSSNEELTNDEILHLEGELSDTRLQTRNFDCTDGKYFYFAIPEKLCSGIKFITGGLNFSAMTEKTVLVENKFNHVARYNVYRSQYIQNGSFIQVQVA